MDPGRCTGSCRKRSRPGRGSSPTAGAGTAACPSNPRERKGGRRPRGPRGPGLGPPGLLQPQALGHGRVPRPAEQAFPAVPGRVRVPPGPPAPPADLPRQPARHRAGAAARHLPRLHRRDTPDPTGSRARIPPRHRRAHPRTTRIPTFRHRPGRRAAPPRGFRRRSGDRPPAQYLAAPESKG